MLAVVFLSMEILDSGGGRGGIYREGQQGVRER